MKIERIKPISPMMSNSHYNNAQAHQNPKKQKDDNKKERFIDIYNSKKIPNN